MTLQPQQHPDALSDMVHAYVERIRELEAELAAHEDEGIEWRRGTKAALERIDQLTARAEKAEGMYRMVDDALTACTTARKQVEARVAELEADMNYWARTVPHDRCGIRGPHGHNALSITHYGEAREKGE